MLTVIYVVNALLHKGFPNPYLSRYNSISLYYQCQTGHEVETINAKPMGKILPAINVIMEKNS